VDSGSDLTKSAVSATVHCLTGCAFGEILGLVIATALDWGDVASMVLAIALAFVFGYSFTLQSLLRSGLGLRGALPIAFASDTFSIVTMETIDTATILVIPGAMAAGLGDGLFWGSLAGALFLAFWAALPVNRWLIARGKGHAVMHAHHAH
jgi:hypothetical protein